MAGGASDKMTIRCQCGVALKVPKSAVGRKVKCPKCARMFVIPAPEITPAHADQESGLLDELARLEQSGAALEQPERAGTTPCPECGTQLPDNAHICVSCGYDDRTGKKHKVASVRAAKVAKATRQMSRFALGTVLSGAGALIGATVWFLIALYANIEIGWIAWGVGLLAGFGMLLGYGTANTRAGLVAAGVSTFGLILAKVMIFAFVMYGLVTGDTDNVGIQRAFLAAMEAERVLDERGIWGADERQEQWETVFAAALKPVSKMDDEEVTAAFEQMKADLEREASMDEDFQEKVWQLAQYRADLRALKQELSWNDPARYQLAEEECARCEDMPQEELADAIAAMEEWERGGRWDDQEFVENTLVETLMAREDAARQAKEQEETGSSRGLSRGARKKLRANFRARVEAMPPEQQAAELKAIELDEKQEFMQERLARHRAERQAQQAGLAYWDDARMPLYDAELEKCGALESPAIQQAIAELVAWEDGGKWSDEQYVRDDLIHRHIDLAMEQRDADVFADEGKYRPPTDAEWQEMLVAARAKVDSIPPQERREYRQAMETDQAQRWQEQWEAQEREAAAEAAQEGLSVFFKTMFGPIDILFFILAVGSAFGLASSGSLGND